MEDASDFIDHYRPKLLTYLDAENNASPGHPGPLEFVDEVLDSWCDFAEGRVLEQPSLQERTFWFALYQLEELVEYPATKQFAPYEAILM